MPGDVRILRADSPERAALERAGWVVVAHSWGARLEASRSDRRSLRELAARADPYGGVRRLTVEDMPGALALDEVTLHDYPGAEATAHTPLTSARAAVGASRHGYAVLVDRAVIAMTWVDLDLDAGRAEVDFTVVAPHVRGRGLATAVKAALALDLFDSGVTVVRTGGASDNAAIMAANRALGFEVDEEWVTLKAAGGATSGQL